jgi:hypothetical protein
MAKVGGFDTTLNAPLASPAAPYVAPTPMANPGGAHYSASDALLDPTAIASTVAPVGPHQATNPVTGGPVGNGPLVSGVAGQILEDVIVGSAFAILGALTFGMGDLIAAAVTGSAAVAGALGTVSAIGAAAGVGAGVGLSVADQNTKATIAAQTGGLPDVVPTVPKIGGGSLGGDDESEFTPETGEASQIGAGGVGGGGEDIQKEWSEGKKADKLAIAKSVFNEYTAQEGQITQQNQQALGALSGQEMVVQGRITASSAARGIKVGSGSALAQLLSQRQTYQTAATYQAQQGAASVAGVAQEQDVAYATAQWNIDNSINQANQDMSNAWLSAFTFATKTATDIMKMTP